MNQRNGTGAPSPPSGSPSLSLSPTRVVSPSTYGASGNTSPGGSTASLRDKISKFEKKGGTPVPRGSFGIGVPPPPPEDAVRRKGELYGNRVPGLGRPQHAPPGFARSATGVQPVREGETALPRRAVSSAILGRGAEGADSPRAASPELRESGQSSPRYGSRAATPLGEIIRAGSPRPRSPPVGESPVTPSIVITPEPGLAKRLEEPPSSLVTNPVKEVPQPDPSPSDEVIVSVDAKINSESVAEVVIAPASQVSNPLDHTTKAPLEPATASTTLPVATHGSDASTELSHPTDSITSADVSDVPEVVADDLASVPISETPVEGSEQAREAEVTPDPSPLVEATIPSATIKVEPPRATLPLVVTPPPFNRSTRESVAPTPVSAADSDASELASLISRYASPTPASAFDGAPQGLSALAAHAATLGQPATPSSSATATAPSLTPSSLAIPSGIPDTPSLYSATSASAYSPSVYSPAISSPVESIPSGVVAADKPSAEPTRAENSAARPATVPVKVKVSKAAAPPPPPQAEYIEPVLGPPPAAKKRNGSSTFTAVVHRKTASPPSASASAESDVTPPARARVQARTVTEADAPLGGDDLSALLANAWRLEERLETGPIGTPQQDSFADAMANAFADIGGSLAEAPVPAPAPVVPAPAAMDEKTGSSHKRTQSELTLKPADETKPATVEALQESPSEYSPYTPQFSEPATPDFSELGEQVVSAPHPHVPSDEFPPTPPPKSAGPRYFSSLRSMKSGTLRNRMSMLLPDSASVRNSFASSEDSAPVGTPPPGDSDSFDAVMVTPPRLSRSSGHLRDDVSMQSRQSGGSSWSFRSSSKKGKGLQRAATFAEKIWPGSRSRSRTPSTMSMVGADHTIGAPSVTFLDRSLN